MTNLNPIEPLQKLRCTSCGGTTKMLCAGGIYRDCVKCDGNGYVAPVSADVPVQEDKPIERKRHGSRKTDKILP